jgi:phosphoserine phosphatase RsbU/P
MRILIADDEPTSLRLVQRQLESWGYGVELATDGLAAWETLQRPQAPPLAILDWMMPGLDGPATCRRLRARTEGPLTYVIMLTALGRAENVVAALEAGADDYLTKPFVPAELRARVQVGERILALNATLRERVAELEAALAQVTVLQGLLPLCAYCRRVRTDEDYWQRIEDYLGQSSDVRFTHGICPECYQQHIGPQLRLLQQTNP